MQPLRVLLLAAAAISGHPALGQSASCADNPSYIDEKQYPCAWWREYDCSRAFIDYDYTRQGEDNLLENCPSSCGLCTGEASPGVAHRSLQETAYKFFARYDDANCQGNVIEGGGTYPEASAPGQECFASGSNGISDQHCDLTNGNFMQKYWDSPDCSGGFVWQEMTSWDCVYDEGEWSYQTYGGPTSFWISCGADPSSIEPPVEPSPEQPSTPGGQCIPLPRSYYNTLVGKGFVPETC
jgi:hypothetical protein